MCCYLIRFTDINAIRIVGCMHVVAILQFSYKPDAIFKLSYMNGNEIFRPPDVTY
jgi:hypothetical protein